jgi:GPH family glycoside/pentoside/hexuronide:cation symporter
MSESINVPVAGPKPIPKKMRIFYGVGDYCFSTMTNAENYFMNFFLTNVAEFALPVVTGIQLIMTIVDAALGWVPGAIINATKPGRYGRYRTWLVTLPWIVPFLFIFKFLKIGDGPLSWAIIVVGSCLANFVWNIHWVANLTLVSVCGGTAVGRAMLSSSRTTWNALAAVTFGFIGLPLATFLSPFIGEQNRFAGLAFILAWVMALGYFVNFLVTSGMEEIETREDLAKKKSKTSASGKDMLKSLSQNSHLICLMIADMARWLARFVSWATAIYYFTYVARNMALLPIYMTISGISGVVGSFLSGILAKKISNRNALVGCYILMIIAFLLTYLNFANPVLVIAFMSVFSIGINFCGAVSIACYSDAAVYSQWKIGADARGWIMGLSNLPLKIGLIARVAVVNAALGIIGFNAAAIRANPELVTVGLQRGITASFTIVPSIFLAPAVLLLIFGYKLNREIINKYQEEINARLKK